MARNSETTTGQRNSNNNGNSMGAIREEDFSVIMAHAFATYGLSVVTDRALPDARDGLKPVRRRILVGMREVRYLSNRPMVKSAEVGCLILDNYHIFVGMGTLRRHSIEWYCCESFYQVTASVK